MLKNELPEMAGYLLRDVESAATKLHRESTQMADVLFEYALARNASLLVDGSLRNVEYYETLLDRIRGEFPQYRLAILHIVAARNVIYQRAEERAKRTGRVVPRALLDASIEQVPRSVRALSEKVDVTYVIRKDEGEPLEIISQNLAGGETRGDATWSDFRDSWRINDDASQADDSSSSALGCCSMSIAWNDTDAHNAARAAWGGAYPNFCPRCQLSCDGQCGICIHGVHRCSCEQCNNSCQSQ